jgi:hypothetical protein
MKNAWMLAALAAALIGGAVWYLGAGDSGSGQGSSASAAGVASQERAGAQAPTRLEDPGQGGARPAVDLSADASAHRRPGDQPLAHLPEVGEAPPLVEISGVTPVSSTVGDPEVLAQEFERQYAKVSSSERLTALDSLAKLQARVRAGEEVEVKLKRGIEGLEAEIQWLIEHTRQLRSRTAPADDDEEGSGAPTRGRPALNPPPRSRRCPGCTPRARRSTSSDSPRHQATIRLVLDTRELGGRAENLSSSGVLFFSEGDLRVTVEVDEQGQKLVREGRLVRAQRMRDGRLGWAVEFDPR